MLTLIIPAYNEEKYIATCLDHVLLHADGLIDEIIVVDNASTDNTVQIVHTYTTNHPHIKLVHEPQKWLTKARQCWFSAASGDILAYIDADTRMPSWWTRTIVQQFTQNPRVGFISGPYSYYDLTRFEQMLNWLRRRCVAYLGYLCIGYLGIGGNFAIRRAVLEQMGGFDTSIAFYGEDTDIVRRAAKLSATRFLLSLTMPTSARRLKSQWALKTTYLYMANYLTQVVFHKPLTTKYEDFR